MLTSCTYFEEIQHKLDEVELKEKIEKYKKMQKSFIPGGWSYAGCDSLLFTSLCKVAGACSSANIFDAEGPSGRWFRTPQKDCYPQNSKSDISKDMFTGLNLYLADLGKFNPKEACSAVKRLYIYGIKNDWIMGNPPSAVSRVYAVPSLRNRWKRIADKYCEDRLATDVSLKNLTDDFFDSYLAQSGYRGHLQVLSILFDASLDGKISKYQLEILKSLVRKNPNNALYQAALHRFLDGDQRIAVRLLLDETKFPKNNLPTTKNYCTHYLYQRDEFEGQNINSDWVPCPGNSEETYDAIDFLFAAKIAGFN
jgi:hypothetical protein